MNIYVASSWRNEHQQSVVRDLRSEGYEVYDYRNPPNKAGFGWEQIDGGHKTWSMDQYMNALKHPLAQAGFNSDFDAMKEADACVMVTPTGSSAHLELGWFVGQGKPTIIYFTTIREPELMIKMVDCFCFSIQEVVSALKEIK